MVFPDKHTEGASDVRRAFLMGSRLSGCEAEGGGAVEGELGGEVGEGFEAVFVADAGQYREC